MTTEVGPLSGCLPGWKRCARRGFGERGIRRAGPDLLDGAVNGRPALRADTDPKSWQVTFLTAFKDLERRIDKGLRTAVDSYALESPAEVFAVVSELFFEKPHTLRREYPDVYELLAQFYRQDPGLRL